MLTLLSRGTRRWWRREWWCGFGAKARTDHRKSTRKRALRKYRPRFFNDVSNCMRHFRLFCTLTGDLALETRGKRASCYWKLPSMFIGGSWCTKYIVNTVLLTFRLMRWDSCFYCFPCSHKYFFSFIFFLCIYWCKHVDLSNEKYVYCKTRVKLYFLYIYIFRVATTNLFKIINTISIFRRKNMRKNWKFRYQNILKMCRKLCHWNHFFIYPDISIRFRDIKFQSVRNV